MEPVTAPVTATAVEKKGPLESRTVQVAIVGLVASIVGHFYPPVGEWMNAHTQEIVGVLSTAVLYGRSGADQKIDWKSWGAVKFFDKKF